MVSRGKGGRFVRNPRPTNLLDMGPDDLFGPALFVMGTALVENVNRTLYQTAGDIEDWMKQNAPWSDRTTDAREGLTASATEHPTHPYITVYHTVDYGVWLEIRWNGRYAILVPAIEHWGPEVMQNLKAVI